MTVCIANVAAKSQAIVLISDKAVRYGGKDSAPLVSDTEARKLLRIGNTFWYALIAGDPSFAYDVVTTGAKLLDRKEHLNLPDTLGGMMYCMKSAYQKCRERAVEEEILKPRLLNRNLVVARPVTMQPLSEDTMLGVMTLAKDFKTDCSLLICGFDATKEPHIFSVVNPGRCDLHDLTGFFAVGIGAKTAISRLLLLEARKSDRLELAIYQGFDAKVNAETVEDVGYNWDAAILVPHKEVIAVPKGIIGLIEKIYSDFPLHPFIMNHSDIVVDAKRSEKLSKYVESVLHPRVKRPSRKSTSRKSKSKR